MAIVETNAQRGSPLRGSLLRRPRSLYSNSIGGPQTALRAAFGVPLHHRRGGIDCFACLEGVPQRSFSPCSPAFEYGLSNGQTRRAPERNIPEKRICPL
jgi:hypothetical protein